MGTLGAFADARPGRLKVSLTGVFLQSTRRDAGFPSGTSNKLVRAVVNGTPGPAIDRYTPNTVFELDYPGGGVAWTVSTEQLADFYGGGTAQYGFIQLKVIVELIKK